MLFLGNRELLYKQPCYSSSGLKPCFIQTISEWCLIAFCLPAYLLFCIRWPCYQCSFAWGTSKGGSGVIRAFLSCSQRDFLIAHICLAFLWILARWNHCGSEKISGACLVGIHSNHCCFMSWSSKGSSTWVTLHIWAVPLTQWEYLSG